jgi:RNA polymerase sigma-70 factor (ECF subfamily)
MTYLDSASFMKDFLAKDRKAHNALFNAFYRELFAFAYNITDRTDEADDIVIQAFTKLFEQPDRFSNPQDRALNIRMFMYRIVKNASLDSLKMHERLTKHQLRFIELLDKDMDFEYTIMGAELQEARLRSAVNKLPIQTKEVLRLVYFEKLSHAEAAESLAVSINTVRTHLSKAKSQLRYILMSSKSLAVSSVCLFCGWFLYYLLFLARQVF